ncbi:Lectin [Anabarilius grahami]|uniref:Lectin n=1 Tax=Anabarilius grahami TaxID=495550 RepID=A0A3N0XJY8_ANAGA|nr:Lectin [Anabarilius grahami]
MIYHHWHAIGTVVIVAPRGVAPAAAGIPYFSVLKVATLPPSPKLSTNLGPKFSCKSKAPGGHLVSVHNTKANGDVLCIVIKFNPRNLRIWIGGFEFFQSGKFVWTDGSSWNYQIWTPGEPNHVFTYREDCVEMNWNHVGKWNDDACYVKKNYMCAFKVTTALP